MYVFFFFFFLAEALWMEEPSLRWIFCRHLNFFFFFYYKVLFVGVTFKSKCSRALHPCRSEPLAVARNSTTRMPVVDAKVVPH